MENNQSNITKFCAKPMTVLSQKYVDIIGNKVSGKTQCVKTTVQLTKYNWFDAKVYSIFKDEIHLQVVNTLSCI